MTGKEKKDPAVSLSEILKMEPISVGFFREMTAKKKEKQVNDRPEKKTDRENSKIEGTFSKPVITDIERTKDSFKKIAVPEIQTKAFGERKDKIRENNYSERSFSKDEISLPMSVVPNDLIISLNAESINLSQEQVRIQPGDIVNVKISEKSEDSVGKEQLTIFVRNKSIISWNGTGSYLRGELSGNTEMYVIHKGKMTIIPVYVGGREQTVSSSSSDSMMVRLDNILEKDLFESEKTQIDKENRKSDGKISVMASRAEAELTLKREAEESGLFKPEEKLWTTKTVTLQFIDERSLPELGQIFPASGVEVEVIGTSFKAVSDFTGLVSFSSIPGGARLLVNAIDPSGIYLPATREIQVSKSRKDEVIRYKLLTHRNFDLYSSIYDTVQKSSLASFCGNLRDSGGVSLQNMNGLKVAMRNNIAEGAYYFNKYGPDRSQVVSGVDGRFCFFNIKPGLIEVSI
ncbi:MAG: hypothetical protein HQK54_01400, partial [Oligoflexales bacterium]|nr:hypothetical protein [Oligoflexales bacterium]